MTFSFMKDDDALRKFALELMESSLKESEDKAKKTYLTDKERRQLVREYREAKANSNEKEAKRIVEILFADIEKAIYHLANSLSSGERSTRSIGDGSMVHNDAEELKAIGVMGFLRALDGGEMTTKGVTRATGFDPDGPGTFMGFMMKVIEGSMKNAHTKEKIHFGDEKTSLDAPRGSDDGGDDDVNLYNQIFPDSSSRFDRLTSDQDYENFLDSDAYNWVIEGVDDLANSKQEKDIFFKYFGIEGNEKMTPTQIGAEYNVSKQRVDQVVKKLLAKLKGYFRNDRDALRESNKNNSADLLSYEDAFLKAKKNLETAKKFLSRVISNPDSTMDEIRSAQKEMQLLDKIFEAFALGR